MSMPESDTPTTWNTNRVKDKAQVQLPKVQCNTSHAY